jgi:hypothetical protein
MNVLRLVQISVSLTNRKVALGGLVVSVLAAGFKVRGFKPGRGRWIFKGDKIRSTPLEGK